MADALYSLDRIHVACPTDIRGDVEFLRANVYVSMGRANDAAPILERLEGEDAARLLRLQPRDRDLCWPTTAMPPSTSSAKRARSTPLTRRRAIRDKSNLVRGTLLMQSGQFVEAKGSLERVRLTGPSPTRRC